MNNLNNLLELGGSVDLIATAICDFNTPTKSYKEGDIVLNLTGLDIQLITSDRSHRAASKKVDLEHATLNISSLHANYVPMEKQLYDLLGNAYQDFDVVKSEVVPCVIDGLLMLTEYVDNKDSIRIFGIENYTIEVDSDKQITTIYSEDIFSESFYNVQYSKTITKSSITLDSFDVDIPYLKIQLKINGNIDKKTSESYLFVEKVCLHFIPVLQFTSNGVTHCTLRFNVIDSENKPQLVI